jgi:2-keto-4-pentenoate hydratase/2-oxohepta-3-ene-1,7-dioic acid hydratase in catechol pathway
MTKLIRFEAFGVDRLGVDQGEYYVDATRAYEGALRQRGVLHPGRRAAAELPSDALQFFEAGADSLNALREALDYVASAPTADRVAQGYIVRAVDARLLVPIPNPRKIVCVARNFGKHAAEAGLQISEIPILFPRFAATLIADGEAIEVPPVSGEVDWEGELAVVIGVGGRYISMERALDHVAGYTVFNDVSIRDYQFRVTQYTEGKNFATSGPIGPNITLTDEAIDPNNAQITTTVNGVLKQDASTSEFIFDIATIIHHISEFINLEPGDIIPMGTPAGVGFKRNPPEFLTPGDVVEVTVAGIGTLRNPVIAGTR